MSVRATRPRIGIFDHTGASLGGGTLVAAHLAALLSEDYAVDLIRDWSVVGPEMLSSAFSLDLAKVNPQTCEAIWDSFAVPGHCSLAQQLHRSQTLTSGYNLFLYAGHWVPPFCHAQHGLIYCHFPMEYPHNEEFAKDIRWGHRNYFDRWLRCKAYEKVWQVRLKGYDAILANSAFTAGWMERRWGTRAAVLYPPIDLEVPDKGKVNRIVSIGRFFGIEPRCKGHFSQVAAFRNFLSRSTERWEMWMIGSCFSEKDRAYLSAVQNAARDLPIRFLVNINRDVVLQALAEAKVFWHTAGLFENKVDNPNFAEHFGMATVEAMRAGSVPIVVNSGGQREIIEDGVSGFLSEDLTELVQNTVTVAKNPSLRFTMAVEAKRRSKDFSGQVFDRRILGIVRRTLLRPRMNWNTYGIVSSLYKSKALSRALY